MSQLENNSVLVLNKAWQALRVSSVRAALSQMAADASTGLDISPEGDSMVPVKWADWLNLPVREHDQFITSPGSYDNVSGERSIKKIRIPTVIVLAKYAKVPKKRPRFTRRNIHARDGGRCQYTGRLLAPGEGNLDHVIPRSRGGTTSWENIVLSDPQVNFRKANRTPEEAGLTLLSKPSAPKETDVATEIVNRHNIPDWNYFLKR